jgi:hypothetical protein
MDQSNQGHTPWRSFRIPLRVVDRVYGRDNADNAGDDMVSALRQVSDARHRYRFHIDTGHSNPWYHALVFEVEALPESSCVSLAELLAGLGLVEPPDSTRLD